MLHFGKHVGDSVALLALETPSSESLTWYYLEELWTPGQVDGRETLRRLGPKPFGGNLLRIAALSPDGLQKPAQRNANTATEV